jgi:hypothetical protein
LRAATAPGPTAAAAATAPTRTTTATACPPTRTATPTPPRSSPAPRALRRLDNDCDGEIDEEAVDASTFYADGDGDGYGDDGQPCRGL